jgi:uncharacterized membrane protein YkgB
MAERLNTIGIHITRYGLVIVLLWIGGMKFTAYEAEGIKPLVANSPLMGWVYRPGISRCQQLLGSYSLAETAMRRSGGHSLPERARIHQSSPNW